MIKAQVLFTVILEANQTYKEVIKGLRTKAKGLYIISDFKETIDNENYRYIHFLTEEKAPNKEVLEEVIFNQAHKYLKVLLNVSAVAQIRNVEEGNW